MCNHENNSDYLDITSVNSGCKDVVHPKETLYMASDEDIVLRPTLGIENHVSGLLRMSLFQILTTST